MHVTVQLADLGPTTTVRTLARRPVLADVPGLRSAETALLAPLAFSRPPPVSRAGLVAFWDDEDAADDFIGTHPLGRRFSGGIEARLRPLRAYGSWPGLSTEVPTTRAVPHDGPVVVLTLARLRTSQALRFARTSRPAEKAAVAHDGMLWGTAAVRFPFLATISIRASSQASASYAFGKQHPDHSAAIAEQHRKDFHNESAFIRFAAVKLQGDLRGSNPLDASTVAI